METKKMALVRKKIVGDNNLNEVNNLLKDCFRIQNYITIQVYSLNKFLNPDRDYPEIKSSLNAFKERNELYYDTFVNASLKSKNDVFNKLGSLYDELITTLTNNLNTMEEYMPRFKEVLNTVKDIRRDLTINQYNTFLYRYKNVWDIFLDELNYKEPAYE